MIVYYFIFYSVYKVLRLLGNKDFPMFGAVGLLSIGEVAILGIMENLGLIQIFKGGTRSFMIGLVLLVYYINYLLLIKNINHKELSNRFDGLNIYIKITLVMLSMLVVFTPYCFFFKSIR